MSKDLVCNKEEIKCSNLIKQYKYVSLQLYCKIKQQEHDLNWLQIPDHPYRVLIIGGSESGEVQGWSILMILKLFMEYLNDLDNIYQNNEEYYSDKKQKALIVFDDMAADMQVKHNAIVIELSIRGRKLNISLVFITQSYFAVLKKIRLNSTHYFNVKIPKKSELQQIAFNHLSDIDFQGFMNLDKKCTANLYSFLVINTTLASDNTSHFRKNLLERI